jgi:hypothetical protein
MHLPGIGNITKMGQSEEPSIQDRYRELYFPPQLEYSGISEYQSYSDEEEQNKIKAKFPWILALVGGAGLFLLLRRPSYSRFGKR